MQLTSYHAIRKDAVERLGEAVVADRERRAKIRGWRIADDPKWFPEDDADRIDRTPREVREAMTSDDVRHGRAHVAQFFAWRLMSLALQLNDTNAEKLLTMDHDSAAAVVVQFVEKGTII